MSEPTATPKSRYPLTMHKLQGGKLLSGPIVDAAHEAKAIANGWNEDPEAARTKLPEEAKAAVPATVEERLAILEAWMAEEKQQRS